MLLAKFAKIRCTRKISVLQYVLNQLCCHYYSNFVDLSRYLWC